MSSTVFMRKVFILQGHKDNKFRVSSWEFEFKIQLTGRKNMTEVQAHMKGGGELRLVNILEIRCVIRINIKTAITDITRNKGIEGKSSAIVSLHNAIAQQRTPFDPLLNSVEGKDIIGIRTTYLILIYKVPRIGKPYLMSKVPHAG